MLDHAEFLNPDMPLRSTDVPGRLEGLSAARSVQMYRLMLRARLMEEQMVLMTQSGETYFWIGGPGEEALNVALGLQVEKGYGPEFDYLHLHYRNSAALLALGMPVEDGLRQAAMRRTDPHSMGRNFTNHFARRDWNVLPVSSVIGVQFAMAAGTALMQKRCEGQGVTIVVGGDAGTAEGDFASCLVWSSRPGNEVPVLMIVTNNRWGISTAAETQHGEKNIHDRAGAFGIPSAVIDGNDPIAAWQGIERALDYCRTRRRPYLLEARVSRLHGHSSASGAKRVHGEPDCLSLFERRLLRAGILTPETVVDLRKQSGIEVEEAVRTVLAEPHPEPADVVRHTFASSRVDSVYPNDYTGLPA